MKDFDTPSAGRPPETIGLPTIFTTALWLVCVAAGTASLFLRYVRPEPVRVQLLPADPKPVNVLLLQPVIKAPTPSPVPETATPPADPPPVASVVQAAPAMISPVAAPVLQPPAASPVRPATPAKRSAPATAKPAVTAPPVYQPIAFGTGEGDQPPPDYPDEAARDGQQGTVTVRFHVDTDGSVTDVDPSTPCQWPLLNLAAVRCIRDSWKYPAGPDRYYEVSITFKRSN